MGRLKNSRGYLCGAMDLAKDNGLGWRAEITPHLKEMGIVVFDPSNKPTSNKSEQNPEYWINKKKLKDAGKFEELRILLKPTRAVDLRMVNKSDFLLVYLDIFQYPCGTYEEIFEANNNRTPVIIVCPHGIEKIPDWLFATLPYQLFFQSFDQAIEYLHFIDSAPIDKIETYGRWQFFNL